MEVRRQNFQYSINDAFEMIVQHIENVEELVAEHINQDKKIVDIRVSRLDTTEWENNFLRIDLTLKDEKRYTQEELNLIGKLIPEDRCSDIKKEIGFYKIIVPTLQDFQEKNGISETVDCFPKFLGARINLQSKNDTLLILENLQEQGYENARECDLPTAKLVLENLARLHAIPIALRSSKPDKFERKLKPFLAETRIYSNDDIKIDVVKDIVREGGYTNVSSKIDDCISCKQTRKSKEPFLTISHGDFWIKNILVRLEHGDPASVKFLDFQNYSYDSLVKDLVYFLLTSVQLQVLKENLDELLESYYDMLVEYLKRLDYKDVHKLSHELFLEEIGNYSWRILPRILFVVMVIDERTESGNPRCPSNFADLVSREKVSVKGKSKVWWIIDEFTRRGWMNL